MRSHRYYSAADPGERGRAHTLTGGQDSTTTPAPVNRRHNYRIAIRQDDELSAAGGDGDGGGGAAMMDVTVHGGDGQDGRRPSLQPPPTLPESPRPHGRDEGERTYKHAGGRARVQDATVAMRRSMSTAHNIHNITVSIVSIEGVVVRKTCDWNVEELRRLHGETNNIMSIFYDGRLGCQETRRRGGVPTSNGTISRKGLHWGDTVRQIPVMIIIAPLVHRGRRRRTGRPGLRVATSALVIKKRRWTVVKRRRRRRSFHITRRLRLGNARDEPQSYGISPELTINTSDCSGDETVIVVKGRGPMGLEGGGPHPAAGVLRWLYESDEECEETEPKDGPNVADDDSHEPLTIEDNVSWRAWENTNARDQEEVMIQWDRDWKREQIAQRIVTGFRNGRRTYICGTCNGESSIESGHDDWQYAHLWQCPMCATAPED